MAPVDTAEPEGEPDKVLFIHMKRQSCGQKNAEWHRYGGNIGLSFCRARDRHVEDALAAGLPEDILEQHAALGAIGFQLAAGKRPVTKFFSRLGSGLRCPLLVPAATMAAAIRIIFCTFYSRLPNIQCAAGAPPANLGPYGNPTLIRNHIVRAAPERYRARK